ncbi:MAG: divalent-cation tolerance protein CutA [Lentisphaeria bacterium]|nr:divalent-cation tolerance protein CutA [Lentisphaeria bacterium]
MTEDLCIIYSPVPDIEVARKIGQELVVNRLVACVNMLPGMESIYEWKGKIETGHETVLIAKTSEVHVQKAMHKIRELHPYDCPCIMTFDMTRVNQPFAHWMMEQMKPEENK